MRFRTLMTDTVPLDRAPRKRHKSPQGLALLIKRWGQADMAIIILDPVSGKQVVINLPPPLKRPLG